jgi:hypothetical protein
MAERDYKSTPVADALGIRGVIDGLATDLQDLRSGKISPVDAMARAHLAKQFFNGARLVLLAMKELHPPKPPEKPNQSAQIGGVM